MPEKQFSHFQEFDCDVTLLRELRHSIQSFVGSGRVARGIYFWAVLRDAAYAQNLSFQEALGSANVSEYRQKIEIITRFKIEDLGEVLIIPDPLTFVAPSAGLAVRAVNSIEEAPYSIKPASIEIWFNGEWHMLADQLREAINEKVSQGHLSAIAYPTADLRKVK